MFDTCFKRLQQKNPGRLVKPWENWGFMLGSKKEGSDDPKVKV